MISNRALTEIIDRLIYGSGLTELEAIFLIGRMLLEDFPSCINDVNAAEDAQRTDSNSFLPWN